MLEKAVATEPFVDL